MLAGLLLAGFCGCSKPAAEKATLEGRWTGYVLGQPGAKLTLIITGTHLDYRGAQSNDWCRGTFVLNESARPRQLDLKVEAMPTPEYVGETILGIYELNGNQLRVATAEPGSDQRPASLAGGNGVRVFSFTHE